MFPKATREKQSAWMPSTTTTANRPKLEVDLPDALRMPELMLASTPTLIDPATSTTIPTAARLAA